jgi:hypothetical protein
MTDRTLTRADLEQMAAANVGAFPVPESERRAYAPATRALMAALAEGRDGAGDGPRSGLVLPSRRKIEAALG